MSKNKRSSGSISKRSRRYRKESIIKWKKSYIEIHGHEPSDDEYIAFKDGHNMATKKMRRHYRSLLNKYFGDDFMDGTQKNKQIEEIMKALREEFDLLIDSIEFMKNTGAK